MQSVHVCTFEDITMYGMSYITIHKTRAPATRAADAHNHWTYHKRLNNNFTLPVPNPMER